MKSTYHHNVYHDVHQMLFPFCLGIGIRREYLILLSRIRINSSSNSFIKEMSDLFLQEISFKKTRFPIESA